MWTTTECDRRESDKPYDFILFLLVFFVCLSCITWLVVVVYQNILKRTHLGTKEEQTASNALDSVSKVTAPFVFPSIRLPVHRHSDCSILKQWSTPVWNYGTMTPVPWSLVWDWCPIVSLQTIWPSTGWERWRLSDTGVPANVIQVEREPLEKEMNVIHLWNRGTEMREGLCGLFHMSVWKEKWRSCQEVSFIQSLVLFLTQFLFVFVSLCLPLSIPLSQIIEECNTQVGKMKQVEELIHLSKTLEFDKLKVIN